MGQESLFQLGGRQGWEDPIQQTGPNSEAMVRSIWDTSAYAGNLVHLQFYDGSTRGFSRINLDDVRARCDGLDDRGLDFNVIGKANLPDLRKFFTRDLYTADLILPQYHDKPYQGWINDPAGLIQWKGEHHFFSPFNPVAPLWGPIHWSNTERRDTAH